MDLEVAGGLIRLLASICLIHFFKKYLCKHMLGESDPNLLGDVGGSASGGSKFSKKHIPSKQNISLVFLGSTCLIVGPVCCVFGVWAS